MRKGRSRPLKIAKFPQFLPIEHHLVRDCRGSWSLVATAPTIREKRNLQEREREKRKKRCKISWRKMWRCKISRHNPGRCIKDKISWYKLWRCKISWPKMWRCKVSLRKISWGKMWRCKMSWRKIWRCNEDVLSQLLFLEEPYAQALSGKRSMPYVSLKMSLAFCHATTSPLTHHQYTTKTQVTLWSDTILRRARHQPMA